MFIDARKIPEGETIDADLCVISAGAAGITIALERLGTRLRVVVLESGGFEFDEQTQSLYQVRNVGFPDEIIHLNRLRFFGGTTNHWTGHCRPLDPIDFERREWVPYSGWPISHSAQELLRASAADTWVATLQVWRPGLPGRAVRRASIGARRPSAEERGVQSEPAHTLWLGLQDELDRASNVAVYLYANALELESDDPPRW